MMGMRWIDGWRWCFLLLFLLLAGSAGAETGTPVPLADPFILLHDGVYYAYGTGAADGIEVYVSDDLATWRRADNGRDGLALRKGDAWGDRWFWAPEVYPVKDGFLMYYSADEHICAAKSPSPLGPFVQTEKKPMLADEKAIDNSLFIDADGKPYLFFVRFDRGNVIWMAELEPDLVTIRKKTLRKCFEASQRWEKIQGRINEGPFVLRDGGTYYLTYSANDYQSPFYGVGYAVANRPAGSWSKYGGNPILQKPGNLVGTGHHAFFRDKEGKLRIVFHSHRDKENIHPRNMHIGTARFENGRLIIDSACITPVLAPPGKTLP